MTESSLLAPALALVAAMLFGGSVNNSWLATSGTGE